MVNGMYEETLEKIYTDYHEKVTHLVRKKVADESAVEDIVSDIFMKIAQNISRYDAGKASMATWVFTISNRTVLDYYRTRKVHEVIPEESGENGSFPDVLVDDAALDAELLKEELLRELAESLTKLKVKERDLIVLCYYKEMTLKQAAVMMDMSYANAKVLHKKALTKLGTMLGI